MRTNLSGMTEEQKQDHRRKKQREKMARWRAANPGRASQLSQESFQRYYEKNRAKRRVYEKKYRQRNLEKVRVYNAKWHRENRANNKMVIRALHLKSVYGLTLEQYAGILLLQGGHCAVCPRTPEQEKYGVLHVDHCHDKGHVRGLLCHGCNTGSGMADNIELLQKKIEYLKREPIDLDALPNP